MNAEKQARLAQVGRPNQGGIRNIIDAMSATVETWLHTDWGEHFMIRRSFFGLLVMALYCGFFANNNLNLLPMQVFIAWFVVLCVVGWISALVRRWSGRAQPHTQYTGRPILMRILPLGELTIKRLEPFIVFAIGFAVGYRNIPLGIYLMCSAVALFICNFSAARRERQHVIHLHNNVIEQSVRAERFRDIHGS
jgi:hypothetical protein